MGRVGVRPPLPFLWLSLNRGGVLVELQLLRERHVHQEARWRGYGTAPCRAY